MASQSIDFYIGLVRLFALATLALCFCSDELRRVASFGSSAVLLLGIACGVAVIPQLLGLFLEWLARAYEQTDCKIEVHLLTNAYGRSYSQEISLSAIACRL